MKSLRWGLCLLLFQVGCGSSDGALDQGVAPEDVAQADATADRRGSHEAQRPPDAPGPDQRRPDLAPPKTTVTVAIAADIAEAGRTAHARALAAVVSGHSPAVTAVLLGGDNARYNGILSFPLNELQYYNTYYKPANEANWGQFDAIAFPQSGNHEYTFPESTAQGYFDYFKPRMGAIKTSPAYHGYIDVVGKGYYSFDINGWHFVSLNSNVDLAAGGAQEVWLKNDLAQNKQKPIVAIWHAPRYTCGGDHTDAIEMQPFWAALYDAGADFVFAGHNHFYQRYKPLDKATPQAAVDTANGLTGIVVGSCGVSTYAVCDPPDPRIEKQIGGDAGIGVFFLAIVSDGSYSFEYRLENGSVFDSGSGVSHHHQP